MGISKFKELAQKKKTIKIHNQDIKNQIKNDPGNKKRKLRYAPYVLHQNRRAKV